MPEQPYFLFPGDSGPTNPMPAITAPEGWVTISELGQTLDPPVSGTVVGLAIRELSAEQRAAEAAAADPEATMIMRPVKPEPEMTRIATDPETHQARTFISPAYLGAITTRVTEILQRG